jgi:hypothetical protein
MTINNRIQELILFLKDEENSVAERINFYTSTFFNVLNLRRYTSYASSAILKKILVIKYENIYLWRNG